MKCFYDTRYRCYSRQIKAPINIFLISDIHFAPKVTPAILEKLVIAAKSKNPDYILIPGDLVDHLDTIKDESEFDRLLAWLEQLGQIAPTIIGLGNHDFYRIDHDRKPSFFGRHRWKIEQPNFLIEKINKIANVHMLDNSSYEDDKVYIFGFTQSPEYYGLDNCEEERIRSSIEDSGIMLHDLRQIPAEKLHQLPEHKIKLALVHSPFRLFRDDIAECFKDFDFTISGHTHNGAVPPILHDFWRSDRGLSAPGNAEFMPEHARAGLYDTHLICGAVTTISSATRKLRFLNAAFPINIATLEISKNPLYQRKPNIKHQYHN